MLGLQPPSRTSSAAGPRTESRAATKEWRRCRPLSHTTSNVSRASISLAVAVAAAASANTRAVSAKGKSKKKKGRCEAEGCRVKLKLTDFPCRCGLRCCSKHRYAEKHSCSFAYRSFATSVILVFGLLKYYAHKRRCTCSCMQRGSASRLTASQP